MIWDMLAVRLNDQSSPFCSFTARVYETTPALTEKHPGIIVTRATAPKLPVIPLQKGIQQHVHSCTLLGGCYGFLMKR